MICQLPDSQSERARLRYCEQKYKRCGPLHICERNEVPSTRYNADWQMFAC
ncbi:hypothetical protein EDC30_1068 [Paucimonas lemoignei]|uniref:Uncharacterized protein n=1 Tax=Paucimonas lemoignei TaxID=29443 RepID=A0A4R3HYB3_PAULE|nr:hypothetical protein EDC30_1068 [Paucimonas lemoignei]